MQSSTFWTTADYKRQLWDMYPNVSREYILDAHRAHYMFYASPPGAEPHVQRMLAGTIHAHDMVRDYRVEIVHQVMATNTLSASPLLGRRRCVASVTTCSTPRCT